MKLIIDTNVIISALIRDSVTREIIMRLGFEFFHPKRELKNLEKHEKEIIEKAGIAEEEYKMIRKILFSYITLVDDEKFSNKLEEAREIMENSDLEDVPFVALALSFDNDGIWTDDKDFKEQNRVRIWTTKELIDFIEKDEELIDEN